MIFVTPDDKETFVWLNVHYKKVRFGFTAMHDANLALSLT